MAQNDPPQGGASHPCPGVFTLMLWSLTGQSLRVRSSVGKTQVLPQETGPPCVTIGKGLGQHNGAAGEHLSSRHQWHVWWKRVAWEASWTGKEKNDKEPRKKG